MAVCAYCKNKCVPSREHIIPSFLYGYQKRYGGHVGWNESAKKIIGSEGKIKDVCEVCNNGVLSRLDEYAKKFLTESGVFVENFLHKEKCISYNYNLLLRWLVKISFNSSRAAKNNSNLFEDYRGFILGDEDKEIDKRVFLLAGLLKPERLSPAEVEKYASQLPISEEGDSNPFFVRLSWVPGLADGVVVRSVVLGAIVFHLIFFEDELKVGFRRFKVRKWLKLNGGMKVVESSSVKMNLNQTNRSFVDLQGMQVLRKEHRDAANIFLRSAARETF